ncbi:MAG: hypothetical protein Q9159_005229 [Coniocarpon cinnabarinum]
MDVRPPSSLNTPKYTRHAPNAESSTQDPTSGEAFPPSIRQGKGCQNCCPGDSPLMRDVKGKQRATCLFHRIKQNCSNMWSRWYDRKDREPVKVMRQRIYVAHREMLNAWKEAFRDERPSPLTRELEAQSLFSPIIIEVYGSS